MINSDFISKRFQETLEMKTPNIRLIRDKNLPLKCFTGLVDGKLGLLFSYEGNEPDLRSSSAVEAKILESRGDHFIAFILNDRSFQGMFEVLFADLLESITNKKTESQDISELLSRFERWRQFWKNPPSALSEEKTRGLAGELYYLEYCLKQGLSARDTVKAWHGIDGADQDFVFENSWVEVKTIRQAATEVEISSLEQLSNPSEFIKTSDVKGTLAVIRMHDDPTGDEVFTLSDLYNRISLRLTESPEAHAEFVASVYRTGANLDKGQNETKLKLRVENMRFYSANSPDFPKLTRTPGIPEAVTKAKYWLSLPAIEPWMTEE